MKIIAPAKINLCFDILKHDKKTGYHKIQTIIQEIPELFNELSVTSHPQTKQSSETIPGDSALTHVDSAPTHLTKKTLKILRKNIFPNTTQPPPIKVKLTTQNIPDASGLGGDSSNAAALLKAINQLWSLHLTTDQLLTLAAQISMDTPFFILGGTALATNFGEKIEPLPAIKNIKFKVCPGRGLLSNNGLFKAFHPSITPTLTPLSKTALAYFSIDLKLCGKNIHKTHTALKAIKNNDPSTLLKTLHNDFNQLYPALTPPHHLSGSGPSTFTVSRNVPDFRSVNLQKNENSSPTKLSHQPLRFSFHAAPHHQIPPPRLARTMTPHPANSLSS